MAYIFDESPASLRVKVWVTAELAPRTSWLLWQPVPHPKDTVLNIRVLEADIAVGLGEESQEGLGRVLCSEG